MTEEQNTRALMVLVQKQIVLMQTGKVAGSTSLGSSFDREVIKPFIDTGEIDPELVKIYEQTATQLHCAHLELKVQMLAYPK